jgi:hypothetical protein
MGIRQLRRAFMLHSVQFVLLSREKTNFEDVQGHVIEQMTYAEHLAHCAVFVLCKSLRKVFMDRLVTDAKLSSTWRPHISG